MLSSKKQRASNMGSKKKQIREAFRKAVFDRDGHKCIICGARADLDAHHITNRDDIPNGGYVKENGITLCPTHHEEAEGGVYVRGHLYSLIDSHVDKAFEAARVLPMDSKEK
jgi:hypothetical protein